MINWLFHLVFIFSLSLGYFALNQKKILFLTDIHLDVLYNSATSSHEAFLMKCKNATDYLHNIINPFDYGRYECNPSEVLLITTLKNVQNKHPDLDLVILGGDLIAHGLYDLKIEDKPQSEINKKLYRETFKKIIESVQEYLPGVPILPIVGNNDFYEHYQSPDAASKKEQITFLKNLYFDNPKNKIKMENLNENFNETVENGMYYTYYDEKLKVKFISLNSNMFSLNNHKIIEEESLKQLDFLEKELEKLQKNNEKGFIMMHIPPYPQVFDNKTGFFFMDNYTQKLEDIVYKYRDNVINTLCGHLHWSKNGVRSRLAEKRGKFLKHEIALKETQFRLKSFLPVKDTNVKYFSLVNLPALTPLFFNNPGYSIISFSPEDKRIANIEQHYADLQKTLNQTSQGEFSNNIEIHPDVLFNITYDFKEDFHFSTFDDEDFYDFIYNRLETPAIFESYQQLIVGYSKFMSKEEKQIYYQLLSKEGAMDFENNFRMFKCSHKVLFEMEMLKCKNQTRI